VSNRLPVTIKLVSTDVSFAVTMISRERSLKFTIRMQYVFYTKFLYNFVFAYSYGGILHELKQSIPTEKSNPLYCPTVIYKMLNRVIDTDVC